MNDWLHNLKAGDSVVVSSNGPLVTGESLTTVDRVTAKQVIVRGDKYRKDGSEITSDRWHGKFLLEATPERANVIREKARREKAIANLQAAVNHTKNISTECLEEAHRILIGAR